MTSLLSFIFVIGVLVFIHELGHYMAARSVGVRVEKFYIGLTFLDMGGKKLLMVQNMVLGGFPLVDM